MVIVQTIRVCWTKKSRGGRFAELRNKIPAALVVPQPSADVEKLVWHDVQLLEENEFDFSGGGQLKRFPLNERFGTKCAFIEFDDSSATLTYRWLDGAPARTFMDQTGNYVPIERTIEIGSNQWGSIEYNGRFTGNDTGNWWYEWEIINVAVTNRFVPDIFVATKPVEQYSKLEKLW